MLVIKKNRKKEEEKERKVNNTKLWRIKTLYALHTMSVNPQPKLIRFRMGNAPPKVNAQSS